LQALKSNISSKKLVIEKKIKEIKKIAKKNQIRALKLHLQNKIKDIINL